MMTVPKKKAKRGGAKSRTRQKDKGAPGPKRTRRASSGSQQAKQENPGWFTSTTGRKARSLVSSASCARNGRLGARATITKHGFDVFFRGWRRWKKQNPSKPELQMIGILATLKLRHVPNWRIGQSYFTLDFYLKDFNCGIELHGRIHKTLDPEKRAKNDAKKRDLLNDLGIEVLWVDDQSLKDVDALIAKVRDFISRRAKKGGS